MFYRGIPFNGGMDSPTGTGGQHIVETCTAICDWLIDGSVPGSLADGLGQNAIDWVNRNLKDDAGITSIAWSPRQAYDSAGGTAIDWNTCMLHVPATGSTAMKWALHQLHNGGTDPTLDWLHCWLYDDSGVIVCQWIDKILIAGDSTTSIDWNARILVAADATTRIDWNMMLLLDDGGAASIDWASRNAADTSDTVIFSWNDGIGFFGATPQGQASGGALSAGALYTATEQSMLNKAYSALRSFGLIS